MRFRNRCTGLSPKFWPLFMHWKDGRLVQIHNEAEKILNLAWGYFRKLLRQPCAPWPDFFPYKIRHSPRPGDRWRTRAPTEGFTASCSSNFLKEHTKAFYLTPVFSACCASAASNQTR